MSGGALRFIICDNIRGVDDGELLTDFEKCGVKMGCWAGRGKKGRKRGSMK